MVIIIDIITPAIMEKQHGRHTFSAMNVMRCCALKNIKGSSNYRPAGRDAMEWLIIM